MTSVGAKTSDYLQNQLFKYKKEFEWIQKELDELKLHRSKLSIIGEMSNSLHFELRTKMQDMLLSLAIIKQLSNENLTPEIKVEYSRLEKIVMDMAGKINETHYFINKNPAVFHKISLKEIIEIIKKDLDIPSGITIERNTNCAIICDPQLIILAFTVILTHLISKINGKGTILINVKEFDQITEIILQINQSKFSDEEILRFFDPFRDQHLCCSQISLESIKEIIEAHKGMIQIKNDPARIVVKFQKNNF